MCFFFLTEGQSLASRISKQIVSASRRLTKALRDYNSVPPIGDNNIPHKLVRSEVGIESDVWQHLATVHQTSAVPHLLRRRLIDNFRLSKRSAEEVTFVKSDMARIVQSLEQEIHIMIGAIQKLKEKTLPSAYEYGTMARLSDHLVATQSLREKVLFVIQKATGDPTQSGNSDDILTFVEAAEAGPLREEKIADILNHIEEFENNVSDVDDNEELESV